MCTQIPTLGSTSKRTQTKTELIHCSTSSLCDTHDSQTVCFNRHTFSHREFTMVRRKKGMKTKERNFLQALREIWRFSRSHSALSQPLAHQGSDLLGVPCIVMDVVLNARAGPDAFSSRTDGPRDKLYIRVMTGHWWNAAPWSTRPFHLTAHSQCWASEH